MTTQPTPQPWLYDDVRGVIVGGDGVRGKLYYGDKCMTSDAFYAYCEADLIEMARRRKHEIIESLAHMPEYKWDDSLWTLRIWGG